MWRGGTPELRNVPSGGLAPAGASAPAVTPVLVEPHQTPRTQTFFNGRGHLMTKWLGGNAAGPWPLLRMGGVARGGAGAPAVTPKLIKPHLTPQTQKWFKVRGHITTKWFGGGATQLADAPSCLWGGIAPAGAEAPAATPVPAEPHHTPKTQNSFKIERHVTTKWAGGGTQLATGIVFVGGPWNAQTPLSLR